MSSEQLPHMKMFRSMENHQISGKGIIGFAQMVTLLKSSNPHLPYPVKGCLVILEQGTDLSTIVAVFHRLKDDNTLGAPVSARAPVFMVGEI